MRIGIDIDGVLTDIEQWQLDYGSKVVYEKFGKGIINPNGYDVDEIFNVERNFEEEFWQNCLFEYATKEPARKFSDEVIKKLRAEGNEIYLITARYLTDKDDEQGNKMRKIVVDWLKENNIEYDKIIFSPEDKLDICIENNINIMIEDKVDNINKISSKMPVICFNANYNKQCEGKNIYRVYSWYDIFMKIYNLRNTN